MGVTLGIGKDAGLQPLSETPTQRKTLDFFVFIWPLYYEMGYLCGL